MKARNKRLWNASRRREPGGIYLMALLFDNDAKFITAKRESSELARAAAVNCRDY